MTQRSLSLHLAIAIEGILCHMTQTKPHVGIRRIVKHVPDMFVRVTKDASKLAEKASVSPVRRRIRMIVLDLDALTAQVQEICRTGEKANTGRRIMSAGRAPTGCLLIRCKANTK
jgi:hypothetical protein